MFETIWSRIGSFEAINLLYTYFTNLGKNFPFAASRSLRRFQVNVSPLSTMDATQIALSEAKAGLPKIADKEKERDVGIILSVSGPGA